MSGATTIIQAIEAASTDEERRKALAPGATDSVFRQVLDLMYDPFVRFGRAGHFRVAPLPVLQRVAAVGGAAWASDAALVEGWAAFSADALWRDPLAVRKLWKRSPAWPIFARVLSKRLEGVSFDVANLWGSLPLFRTGQAQVGAPPTPPFLTLAEPSPCRAIMVVRNLTSPITHWFHDDGDCISDTVDTALLDHAAGFDWSDLGLPQEYEGGIVLDGYLGNYEHAGVSHKRGRFGVADIVPLESFKEQRRTKPLYERIADLTLLNPHSSHHLFMLTFVEASNADHVDVLRAHLVTDNPGAGVLALDPSASYPYHQGASGWTWLREPA